MIDELPDLRSTGDIIKDAPGWLDKLLGTLDKYHMLPMPEWRANIARNKVKLEQELEDERAFHERRREFLRVCSQAEADGIARITDAGYTAIETQIQNSVRDGTNLLSAFMWDPLAVRAMGGWLETTIEERYAQERIAKWACLTALEQPEAQTGQGQTSEEFFARFWDIARGLRDEDTLRFWGRLLAGEIRHVGSVSLGTLNVLRDMSSEEAKTLKKYSKYTLFGICFLKDINTFSTPKELNEDFGILYGAGLIEFSQMVASFELKSGEEIMYETFNGIATLKNMASSSVSFFGCPLTRAGRELVRLDNLPPDFDAILDTLPKSISRSDIKCGYQPQK